MDILLALGVSAVLLVTTVMRGGWILYPLLLTVGLFLGLYRWRGVGQAALGAMMVAGVRKALGVLSILLLIGALIAAWMAAGTVPALVYYGLQLIQPRLFVLSAFGLTALVSVLIGTSFGAVGTIGVALMVMARGNDLSESLVAGAIIAGAYVGDRCSPMSSSAHLVATLTNTDIYRNLWGMAATSWGALLGSAGVYLVWSWQNPLQQANNPVEAALGTAFNLHPITLMPAIAILLLVALRVPVRQTMGISLGLALALSLGLQGYSPLQAVSFLVQGFSLDDPILANLLRGGGLLPMAKVCLVVVVSTALAGLLMGTQTFRQLDRWLRQLPSHGSWALKLWFTGPAIRPLFLGTACISLLTAAYGCTQTLAILLTHQLTAAPYEQANVDPEQLALDLENTAVVLAPLVPWNIAGLVPATLLLTDAGFVPYAVYLYLLPLLNLIVLPHRPRHHPNRDRCNFVQDAL